jgi:hypothetical protein
VLNLTATLPAKQPEQVFSSSFSLSSQGTRG